MGYMTQCQVQRCNTGNNCHMGTLVLVQDKALPGAKNFHSIGESPESRDSCVVMWKMKARPWDLKMPL